MASKQSIVEKKRRVEKMRKLASMASRYLATIEKELVASGVLNGPEVTALACQVATTRIMLTYVKDHYGENNPNVPPVLFGVGLEIC